ncbi:DUF2262 domain-containing protein [Tuwongella immobilis]|uniref:DUF2262 domain-containing protein n=1 Tax=Tuwongella immobilis TaxID=692036 RepID=A0A6C2YLC8_9BACT|nr:DUF2262 domain-containing protein [Tuwongella immobilis]VIP01923.1 Uncharacterized protein OS=Deinococcus radiodurans (strain ATCC 13939 / DSM 20539 / JCM 16871 / LMG 4051 / NBRC 15346 / NCIMB 9279 / R1 / VKM B-1422) GN=DR_0388 PE=4 SV=1: DUF2262 [Tuwongella immobilis]VTR99857.1 Uncharacterized protein OS=Deinococcus radiodurans (strain ATCC 13939 / DSM 20539 / JCM 16871 / LMG 4051 / NBRC 15346 / NCIMB 9279 / R1 / VKM B-1422) GN=DR_0388 PE=4 SV=1: DUF2262 [Tuwongella immobilis]
MADDLIDPELGTLDWDDQLQYWRNEDFPLSERGTISLSLSPSSDDDHAPPRCESLLALLRSSIAWVRRHEPDLRLAVALRMIDLYNETWREDEFDPTPINAETFADRIHLTSLDVDAEGELTLYFDDGDIEMFGGHSIVATLSTDHKLTTNPYLIG